MSTSDPHQEKHADGIVENREKAPPVYFTILFYGLVIWGVAFMAFYLLSGWSSDAEFQAKMATHKGEPQVEHQVAAGASAKPAPAAETPAAPAPAVTAPAPPAAAPAAAAEDGANGKTLFAKHCSGCHGPEGKGAFGPDLSGDYQYGKTTEAVQESIAHGRPKNMPAFEKKLSPQEIEALTDFILKL
jgi:cytochrome c oxidase cbb3-type subunit 3